MKITPLLVGSLLVGASLMGCSSNPTNEASAADIQSANVKRAAAIDADPSMNAEQKAKMKQMLGLDKPDAQKTGK